jgi:hypothetical protein
MQTRSWVQEYRKMADKRAGLYRELQQPHFWSRAVSLIVLLIPTPCGRYEMRRGIAIYYKM